MALGETEVVKTRLSLGQIVLSDTLSPKTMREPSPKRSRRSPLDKSENSQLESNAQSPPGRQEGKGLLGMAETPGTPMTDEMTGIYAISSTATRHVDARAAAEAAATLTDHETLFSMPLTVVIFGATGDLARKKLFPSLYKLCVQGHLPRHLSIVGYGRRDVELNEFLAKQCVNVLEDSSWALSEFYERISFHAGGYDAPSSYEALDATIHTYEAAHPSKRAGNRLFFMSVPPTVFGSVATMIAEHSRAPAGGFTRLMIEKPFGRDSASFEALNQLTARHFDETQLFRIDHYLGKEIILNISTLRWANAIFEPLWSREHIETVQITFKENLGTEGRGGYFDGFGIVRDIIQNHLLQAFMFLAMEPPHGMSASAIIESKVALLKAVKTLTMRDETTFLGQFGCGNGEKGYLDDETVPADSTCPTFASCVLTVDNERWRGVPFLLTAGKGLDERLCEVRVRFRPQPYNRLMGVDSQNELVLRVQPDEAIYMVAVAKAPGICAGIGRQERRTPIAMGLRYATQFGDGGPFVSGDAYERMLLNCCRGDQALSVSSAELVEAWRIFTPMLHEIDNEKRRPITHPFGAPYPDGFVEWTEKHGVDIAPPARHWSAKEAEAHAAASAAAHAAALAARKEADEAAARAEAEAGTLMDHLDFQW